MKYNKVRGILRAKQGSQFPKFLYEGNPYTMGFLLPNTLLDATTNSFNSSILNSNLYNLPENSKLDVPLTDFEQNLWNSRNGELSRTAINNTNFKIPESVKTTSSFILKLGVIRKGLGKKIGNFTNANQGTITTGINLATDKLFGGTEDSGEFGLVTGALGTLQNVPGAVGWAATAANTVLKGINKLGEREIDSHTLNTYYKQKAGSYGGLMSLNSKVESDKNKSFGFFNAGGFDAAQDRADLLAKWIPKYTNIIDTAEDLFAMVNDNNYQHFANQLNGMFNPNNKIIRYNKLGDKINLIKSRKFNQVVNIDTKLVEEFKEGGSLPVWEPIIDDIGDYWEPIIDDIESYREGGKTKEELETPEIEETNQKNLIPEGALHKNKHHIEHTEGLTLKGIPVIDNEGEQLAEIELDEIIFTLEVTKKLEELYEDGSDEATIEAGKLLVKEILFNTDDRTSLIDKVLI